VIFYYTAEGLPELPISFVAKILTLEDEFHTVSWDPSEILFSHDGVSPDISASLSDGRLPNLDADGDGFSNFYEIREGSNPLDPNSIPKPPVLISGDIPEGQQDQIEFTLVFEDASGIAEILPADPVCGYSLWEVTPLDDEGFRTELHGIFNAHAHPAQENITLQISAKDILGLAETFSFSVGFEKTNTQDPQKLGPEIAILRPRAGETLSDSIKAEAVACDEAGISSLKPLKGDQGDTDGSPERYFGNINTSAIGDGAQELSFMAKNLQGNVKVRGVPVIIVNDSPIKVDNPASGSDVQDTFTLIARVDKNLMPDVTDLFVESVTSSRFLGGEEDPDFFDLKFDTNQLAEAYKQTLDTAVFEDHERIFTVTFRAVGSSSGLITREVTYKVNNDPDINFYVVNGDSAGSCITGGSVTLEWQVTNRGAGDLIEYNGQPVTNPSGTGSRTVFCSDQTTKYTLEAVRKNNEARQEINLTKIGISGLKAGDLVDPDFDSFTLTGANENTHWKVEVRNSGQLVNEIEGFGGTVELSGLEPRSDLELVIHILNEAGLTVSKSGSIKVTTVDVGLVGWWRFNNPSQFGKDSSVFNHPTSSVSQITQPNPLSLCLDGSCGDFDGFDSISIFVGPFSADTFELDASQTSFTVEAWVNWDDPTDNNKVIIYKKDQYRLEVNSSEILQFTVMDNSSPVVKRSVIYNQNICNQLLSGEWYHIAGVYNYNAPLGNKPLRLYVNGVNCSSNTVGPNEINPSGDFFYIGWDFLTGDNGFVGLLDEIAVYNRALSGSEILQNFQRHAP
jgi:hypothetical protein